tara:strand:+ start:1901 stop:2104 length:204 start_codon:yes stop_codon:yes gene_type:complete
LDEFYDSVEQELEVDSAEVAEFCGIETAGFEVEREVAVGEAVGWEVGDGVEEVGGVAVGVEGSDGGG